LAGFQKALAGLKKTSARISKTIDWLEVNFGEYNLSSYRQKKSI